MIGFLKRIVRGVVRAASGTPARIPVYVPVLQNELLKGRTALITGGNGGIGYAIADAFLRAGAKAIISGRNKEKLNDAVTRLSSKGSVSYVQLDNTKPDSFSAI